MRTQMFSHKRVLASLFAVAWLASISYAQSRTPEAQGQRGKPGGMAIATATATATVQAVDAAKRTVTLQMPDGTTRTFKAGRDVVNFDRIKPGDQVKATVIEELAVFVRKAGGPPGMGETEAVALAPQGAKPGVIMADTVELTAKIEAIDHKHRIIVLQGPEGQSRAIKIGSNVNLANVRKGDDVVVRYTEGLALVVEKP